MNAVRHGRGAVSTSKSPLAAIPVVLLLLLVGAGCQVAPRTAGDDEGVTALGGLRALDGTPMRTPAGAVVVETTRPSVELGAYAEDARVQELAATWAERVGYAVERVRRDAGIALPAGVVPWVRLEPLGDEDLAWRLGTRIEGGRRVPRIRVNVERLAPRRERADSVLARSIAAAVFEDADVRLGGVPPWVVRAAEVAASGTFAESADRLLRRVVEEGRDVVTVDGDAPVHAESTALAALLVLRSTGQPDAVRRFLRFAAEGDDPDLLLAREVRDPLGNWVGEGRKLLQAHLLTLDARPWQLLVDARRALEGLGRAGLDAELEGNVPAAVRGEVDWLRAKAAADEGDKGAAREILRGMGAERLATVSAIADAYALWARLEGAPGGDARQAALLRDGWVRDFPRRAEAEGLTARASATTLAGMDIVEALSLIHI